MFFWNSLAFSMIQWILVFWSLVPQPFILQLEHLKLLNAKFRLKLKNVGKTTKTFRYDQNQIPYDYTVEVTHRFQGLHLIDRVPEELWTKLHDIVQEAVIETIPNKKKCIKAKWLSEETLQIAEILKKRSERQRRKEKIYLFECSFPKNSKER